MRITGLFMSMTECRKTTLDGTLEGYYALLGCQTIEAPEIEIEGQMISVICDEEGLFKEGNHVSIYDGKLKPMIVGNVFLCKANYDTGEFTSLDDDTMKRIVENHLRMVITERGIANVLVV